MTRAKMLVGEENVLEKLGTIRLALDVVTFLRLLEWQGFLS